MQNKYITIERKYFIMTSLNKFMYYAAYLMLQPFLTNTLQPQTSQAQGLLEHPERNPNYIPQVKYYDHGAYGKSK